MLELQVGASTDAVPERDQSWSQRVREWFAEKFNGQTERLLGWLLVLYILSFVSLFSTGINVILPWRLLVGLVFLAIPYAYCVTRGLFLLDYRFGIRPALVPFICMALGMLVLLLFSILNQFLLVILPLFLFLLIRDLRNFQPGFLKSLASSLVVIVVGYGTVWNLNYLFALATSTRLHDPAILRMDLAIYSWLFSRPVEYQGMFPLFASRVVFQLLENAYLMLFVELFVVILVLVWKKRGLAYFFRSVFCCYFLGLAIFFFYPIVGPCIYYPETLHQDYHSSQTHDLMQLMASEYAAVNKQASVNGSAYFVAMPSLHVAMALIFQIFLSASRVHFWVFVPVNVLMAVSTVLLGFHYVIDFPTGVLVALVTLWFARGKHA